MNFAINIGLFETPEGLTGRQLIALGCSGISCTCLAYQSGLYSKPVIVCAYVFVSDAFEMKCAVMEFANVLDVVILTHNEKTTIFSDGNIFLTLQGLLQLKWHSYAIWSCSSESIMDTSKTDTLILQSMWLNLKFLFSRLWWLIPIILMATIFLAFYFEYIPLQGKDISERGQFGDSFGVLNSLFTGLGFGGIIVTLILQQKQIRQQEANVLVQQHSENIMHYDATLHKLLSLYADTLRQVSSPNGTLNGRSLLRSSTDRVFSALKKEKSHLISTQIRGRHQDKKLTEEDEVILDYLYFRNFKILTVEIDRQRRLVQVLKSLLHHLIYEIPKGVQIEPYQRMVLSQITYVEVSYFFLVALGFSNEKELRELMLKSGLLQMAGNIYRLRIHDYMYEHFWGQNIRDFTESHNFPMTSRRINTALRAYKKRAQKDATPNPSSYSSPRALKVVTA